MILTPSPDDMLMIFVMVTMAVSIANNVMINRIARHLNIKPQDKLITI